VLPSETASDNLQVNSVDGASLIFIPAGEFMMGLTDAQIERIVASCSNCKASSFLPSQPVHAVYLDSYWIYQTEVTNRMYSQCVNAGFCNQPIKSGSKTRSTYFGDPTYDHYPVIFVDWYMANQYCQWAGGRLPTEAEWEKAARGNDQRLFPWGDQMPAPQLANIGLYVGDTTPVGSYPNGASPYGLLDMAGNVYEWVADWYSAEYYSISPANNPMGPSGPGTGKELRVVRGGNLYWEAVFAISAYHDNWEPSLTGNDVGFRCARSP
jgi:formylglycine-generating enzyme required for sulfatase activity